MDLSQRPQEKKRMGVTSHLLTPEEPTIDSFEETQPTKPVEPRSPPESPAFRPLNHDHVLYETSSTSADLPLFATSTTPRATPEREPSPVIAPVLPPIISAESRALQQYKQSLPPVKSFIQQYNEDPIGYRKARLAEIDWMMELKRAKREEARRLPTPTSRPVERDSHTKGLLASLGRTRVVKTGTTVPVAIRARTDRLVATTRPSRSSLVDAARKSQTPTKRTSRQSSIPAIGLGGLPHAAAPKPRTRQPPSKMVERKDQNWREVPDCCPPIESLNTGPKKLSVEWTNKNHQDLSNDEDRIHLHPQELAVASTLRLKCDRYMLIKRLIFQEKVKFLNENKEFNKTSAQNCCNVDVNKISKLWQSFNDVGWFDKHWFEQYLE